MVLHSLAYTIATAELGTHVPVAEENKVPLVLPHSFAPPLLEEVRKTKGLFFCNKIFTSGLHPSEGLI